MSETGFPANGRDGSLTTLARMVVGGWRLLRPGERSAAAGIGFASLLASTGELAALSTTVPFVGLLIDPTSLDRYPMIQDMLVALDLPTGRSALPALGAGVIACLLLAFLFRMGVHILVERFSMRFTNRLMRDTMRGCLGAPYSWLRGQNGAKLAQRLVTDAATVGQALYPVVLEILYGAFILALGIVAIVLTSPWQAIAVIFGLAVVAGAVLSLLNPLAARYAATQREMVITGNQRAVETFSGRKLVKASRAEAFFAGRYIEVFERGNTARMKLNIVNKAIPSGVLLIGQVGLLALALVISGLPTATVVAQLTFVLLVMARVLPAVSSMTGSINKLIKTVPSYRGYMDLRAEIGPWMADPGIQETGRAPAWITLTLDRVAFSYPGADDAQIEDLSLTLSRGRLYGLAGPSGAGKSTAIDLILGLLEPERGTVAIDGVPLQAEARPAWLAAIGYVPQEPYIMDDTLRRNVAFGIDDRKIDDGAIWAALEQAQIADIVRSWPDGLDTVLGDAGSRLSGGQRQRVAIARALYRGATLLVLDEATNALDTVTEESVNATVRDIPGITAIIVAHRLSALRSCDEIFLLEDGQLIGAGDYDALTRASPLFRQLAQEQDPAETAPRQAGGQA
ncbi:MAG: ABC transporter ATP-binding protein [Alphaproteobacteria bacterium]|nr:ABC transporter ATP-binding protein [Alphaproteobacteria bacterium]